MIATLHVETAANSGYGHRPSVFQPSLLDLDDAPSQGSLDEQLASNLDVKRNGSRARATELV